MADTEPLTIHVSRADLDRLHALACSTQRSEADITSEALAVYLAAQEWQVAAIREGVEAADAGGPFLEHSAVAAWLESWGTDNELPPPE
jgi:RHH-type transcriptional regulator, rel operon repressor / antitoxin RelB